MSYQNSGAGVLDQQVCRLSGSQLWVRGPCVVPKAPYVAFLGGSETFGRFVQAPFPALAQPLVGRACVNLGCANSGLDSLLNDAAVMRVAAAAETVVLQLCGAQNLSNQYYRVHPRRNDRFLAPSDRLAALYPEVDFTEFHFTKHLLNTLLRISPDRFSQIHSALRDVWLDRMERLLRALQGRVVLLWLRYPEEASQEVGGGLGADPLLVTRAMIDQVVGGGLGLIEVPVVAAAAQAGEMERMVYGPLQAPSAEHMPGPAMHRLIAERVAERLCELG
ncbi:DUF6473 family protein [Pseudodonghicola xiamenensis]|uniref:DUF6473 domain-containing protein n=1 Tax=Pseudodonghicola xiamenensis TaxID=337702 RepID=A0A8J3HBK4_9RHOB|nr:DUF6473 family protein [Pseudodonghicola xiamenensis]GHH00593.1 hypothetical protein GCM10010961_37350 [Pseudodonghicola xiamenensis]